jgi:hypothetical protein
LYITVSVHGLEESSSQYRPALEELGFPRRSVSTAATVF